jgi:DNA/RNA-binding domain of Phe-tRNA-synthetase-like protein
MNLVISPAVSTIFPNLRIGVLVARGINNTGNPADLSELKGKKESSLREKFSRAGLDTHPHIQAWREVYRGFGFNPKRKMPTAESIILRVLKGHSLPALSPAVDQYLVAELDGFLPVGGYDLSQIEGDICLRHSAGNEEFVPIGAENNESEKTDPQEIIYADNVRVLTRGWNYRDCDKCKITGNSTDIALFTEAPVDAISTQSVQQMLDTMQDYISRFCGGCVKTFIADASCTSSWEL